MRAARATFALVAVAGLAIAVVAPGCTADLRGSAEDVSQLSYWPDPVYTDDPYIDVTFTTTVRARPGFEYVVYQNSWNYGDVTCTSMASNSRFSGGDPKRHLFGGIDKTYRVRMRVLGWDETGKDIVPSEWCPGDATISVALEEMGVDYSEEWSGPELLREVEFEIQPEYTRPPVERWPH